MALSYALLFAENNVYYLSRSKSLCDKLCRVFAPIDNVYLLAFKLVHNRSYS